MKDTHELLSSIHKTATRLFDASHTTPTDTNKRTQQMPQTIQKTTYSPTDFSSNINTRTAPYLFSTENLIDTYKIVPISEKNILTVASSGDHVFDAYLNGAQHVESFDFNPLQEYVLRLKTDLIHRMTYSQFMNFFFGTLMCGKIQESYDILKPFWPNLPFHAQQMMDCFYHSKNQNKFFQRMPFYCSPIQTYKQDKIAYIQSESNFNTLKKRLPEQVDFTLADIDTIARNITKNYDLIHLSNIVDYIIIARQEEMAVEFFDTTIRPLFQHLTDNGTMIAEYNWGKTIFSVGLPNFYGSLFLLLTKHSDWKDLHEPDLCFSHPNIPSVSTRSPLDTLWLIQKKRSHAK